MTGAVIVALIALVGTVANVAITYVLTVRSERRRAIEQADARWARLVSSLGQAATDLRKRIGNILRGHFLDAYGADTSRRDEAMRSTMFRFAQYFGWAEALRLAVREGDPRHEADAQALERVQAEISRLFASDSEYGPGHFMVWREAQRAIGELMVVRDGDVVDTAGVAGFIERLDTLLPWMGGIADAMKCNGPSEWQEGDKRRLTDIADRLNELSQVAAKASGRGVSV